MFDILGLMEPIAILVASVLVYIFVFQHNFKKRSGFYKNPDWNFVFRRWYAERELNKIKPKKQENLNKKLGRNLTERPLLLKNEKSSDMILFYGSDQTGNSILLRMTRLRHRTADLWLTIRLGDGKTYVLPEHPLTRVYEVTTGKFKSAGLEFECLEPFVRWRITYSGYLREGVRNEIDEDVAEHELRFVKFNFFFTASNKPLFWPLDWSSTLMATGLATESWKDGNWANILNIPGNGGYDQFGSLFGQMFLPNDEVRELNLPGLRQRRWEAVQNYNLRQQVSVFGVCNQGCIFNVGAVSYQSGVSHVQYGNVRMADDTIYPIDWTDFQIPNVAEEIQSVPQRTVIHFRAAGRAFKAFLYLQHDKASMLVKGSPYRWRIANIPAKFDLNMTTGHGIVSAWFPYDAWPKEKELSRPYRHKKLVFSTSLPDRNKFCVKFSENEAESKLIAGGKGASLALLTAASSDLKNLTPFEIPQGFVVSSSALRQFLLTNSDVYLELKKLEDLCAKSSDEIEECCQRVKDLFKLSILDREIGAAINTSLQSITTQYENPCFAIRSSGVDEDGKDFSSAGQNETILGVRGFDNILEAVKLCWASLYAYRSVEYRRTHAQAIIADMAVVVQTMVPSECSGVLFTRHSLRNNSTDILITANYGLGETVVSGSVEPDTFVVSKNYDETKFSISETIVGGKEFSLVLKDTGGIEKLQNKTTSEPCLSVDFALRLAQIGVNIEKMYGEPQDIEWAVYKDTIYLLQSRPITTLKQFSDWEYLHELDNPTMSMYEFYTKGNVGEVLVGAIDPLTSSTVVKYLNMHWLPDKNDYLAFAVNARGLVMKSHQVFIEMLTMFKGLKPGKVVGSEKVQAFGLLGSLELTPQFKMGTYIRNGPFSMDMFKEIMSKLVPSFFAARQLRKLENVVSYFHLINYRQKINSFKTSKETLLEVNTLLQRNLVDVCAHHVHISTGNSILQSVCLKSLMEGGDDFTPDHISDLMNLMNAADGVVSAEIPKKLDQIANTIYLQSDPMKFRSLQLSEVPAWLEENCPVAHRQYKQFLRDYGHRCLNEFCLPSIPWENNTEYIIKMIQDNLSQTCLGQGHVHHETNPRWVVEDLKTPKKRSTRWFLSFLVPYCRRSVQRREQSKNLLIYFINVLRKYIDKLAELMQNEGLIPQKQLIFYLTRYELQQLVLHSDTALVQKAIRRQKLYPSWNKLKFPDFAIGDHLKPINADEKIDFDAGAKIPGLPAQNGTVEGRACVLTDISEIDQIQSGDILITVATDIAWSPVFPVLGGLVTELGGLISHGAVVAREYGLPCIIGAKNATNCFRTGDRIYLDANAGFVTKLS